ncbi:DM13 domain-containing protein [Microvirga tunisiensis]|uniref:DM13 domain-containing protein n=1 Tax=Microvirga tunisiensis TaxID=2108360 RepID=UPI00192DA06F
MFVDLGPLRAFKGSQRYAVPNGVDLAQFDSVVIWCREFSVLISPADLQFGGSRSSDLREPGLPRIR